MKYSPSDVKPFYQFINQRISKDDVRVILDIGSLHCLESVEFAKKYKNAKIFAFEANPTSYDICLENSKDYPSIQVINKAVNDYDGTCKFYPIDKEKTITPWEDGNQGASSLFVANGDYDFIEKYVQFEIEIPCTRIDTWCKENNVESVDAVWMDLQGAELKALQSMGNILDTIQVIHTELEMNPIYENQCLFNDVNEFLYENGFELEYGWTSGVQFGSDYIFTRR